MAKDHNGGTAILDASPAKADPTLPLWEVTLWLPKNVISLAPVLRIPASSAAEASRLYMEANPTSPYSANIIHTEGKPVVRRIDATTGKPIGVVDPANGKVVEV